MSERKNILICPLEWGLGHAGRMIALAQNLQERKHNIIFAAGDDHLAFIRNEMPGLTYIRFPGYRPVYSGYLPQYIILLLTIPALIYHIIAEHLKLKNIIAEYSVDIVISDNRFGLWNKNTRTIYVTHQPRIPFPRLPAFLEFTGIWLHRQIIRKYTYCFIPDLPGTINLTGKLTHGIKLPGNVRFIGILSRFTGSTTSSNEPEPVKNRIAVILSGPEPQRGILEKKITDLIIRSGREAVVFGGKPHENISVKRSDNITFHSHAENQLMKNIIKTSEIVIARPGYTTIMELISLGCSAWLIPTPGQTEQEYIACYLSSKSWFRVVPQNKLDDSVIFSGITANPQNKPDNSAILPGLTANPKNKPDESATYSGLTADPQSRRGDSAILPGLTTILADQIIDESRKLLEKALNEISEDTEAET